MDTSEQKRPNQVICVCVASGHKGYATSTVINCEIAITKESVVDIIAAMAAVRVMTARNLLKPPSSINSPKMDVIGLGVCAPSRATMPIIF